MVSFNIHPCNCLFYFQIEAIVEKTYALSEANEALEYLAKGHTHGKVVVIIDGNDENQYN